MIDFINLKTSSNERKRGSERRRAEKERERMRERKREKERESERDGGRDIVILRFLFKMPCSKRLS